LTAKRADTRFQAGTANGEFQSERRRKVRIEGPISASVRGTDSDGGTFELEATLDNLSAGGLYLRLRRRVENAAELSFVFRLPPGAPPSGPGMRIAARGIVRRVESCAEDTCGLGVAFTRYRQI
jgi:hypothetical protein